MTDNTISNPLELGVTNFGPIAGGKIELRPLTVFVGPSNTGKSYMAALIYAIHKFFMDDSSVDPYPHARGVLSYDSILTSTQESHLSESNCNLLFEWFMDIFPNLIADDALARGQFENQTLELPQTIAELVRPYLGNISHWKRDLDRELARCFGAKNTGTLIRFPGEDPATLSLRSSAAGGRNRVFGYDVTVTMEDVEIGASIPEQMPFEIGSTSIVRRLPARWRMNPFLLRDDPKRGVAISLLVVLADEIASRNFDPCRQPAFYLPSDRAGVMHVHQLFVRALIAGASRPALPSDSPVPSISGVLGDYLEQLVSLAGASNREGDNYNRLAQHLEFKLLRGAVRVEQTDIDYPSFVFRPNGWERDLPLMNSSSMVSELLPVIMYLRYVIQPGDLLIIEEPEAHLHPEMQALFTRQLVAAVQSGVRILITTHSEWILEELANLVRLSELPVNRREGIEDPDISLSPDQFGAWFFESDDESGGSIIREISLDEESATFPAGFGLVTESLYNRWVEISTRLQEE